MLSAWSRLCLERTLLAMVASGRLVLDRDLNAHVAPVLKRACLVRPRMSMVSPPLMCLCTDLITLVLGYLDTRSRIKCLTLVNRMWGSRLIAAAAPTIFNSLDFSDILPRSMINNTRVYITGMLNRLRIDCRRISHLDLSAIDHDIKAMKMMLALCPRLKSLVLTGRKLTKGVLSAIATADHLQALTIVRAKDVYSVRTQSESVSLDKLLSRCLNLTSLDTDHSFKGGEEHPASLSAAFSRSGAPASLTSLHLRSARACSSCTLTDMVVATPALQQLHIHKMDLGLVPLESLSPAPFRVLRSIRIDSFGHGWYDYGTEYLSTYAAVDMCQFLVTIITMCRDTIESVDIRGKKEFSHIRSEEAALTLSLMAPMPRLLHLNLPHLKVNWRGFKRMLVNAGDDLPPPILSPILRTLVLGGLFNEIERSRRKVLSLIAPTLLY